METIPPEYPVESVPEVTIDRTSAIILDIQLFDGMFLMVESIHETDDGEWENNQMFYDLTQTKVIFDKPLLHSINDKDIFPQ